MITCCWCNAKKTIVQWTLSNIGKFSSLCGATMIFSKSRYRHIENWLIFDWFTRWGEWNSIKRKPQGSLSSSQSSSSTSSFQNQLICVKGFRNDVFFSLVNSRSMPSTYTPIRNNLAEKSSKFNLKFILALSSRKEIFSSFFYCSLHLTKYFLIFLHRLDTRLPIFMQISSLICYHSTGIFVTRASCTEKTFGFSLRYFFLLLLFLWSLNIWDYPHIFFYVTRRN